MDGLFREHQSTVARWVARLGGPQIEVADVVQDIFLTVHRKLPTFRPEAKVTTWLYQITENAVRDHRRRRRWRKWLGGGGDDAVARLADPTPLALEQAEQNEARARVYRVLDRLNERQRTVLILFEYEGLSGAEIAERLDTKIATVWVWLHRARAALAKQLAATGGRDG